MSLARYYNIHTHRTDNSPGIVQLINLEYDELQNAREDGLFSVGIHPWRIPENFEKPLTNLESSLRKNSSVIAVGEVGLDKCCNTSFTLQELVFKKQLQLAEKYDRPVIIHCVKAWREIIAIKKNHKDQNWIVHGFNMGCEQADSLLRNNFFLSFGTGILKNSKAIESLRQAPLEKIFLETDTSSIGIVELYTKAANIRKVKVEELASSIECNFRNVFGVTIENGRK